MTHKDRRIFFLGGSNTKKNARIDRQGKESENAQSEANATPGERAQSAANATPNETALPHPCETAAKLLIS